VGCKGEFCFSFAFALATALAFAFSLMMVQCGCRESHGGGFFEVRSTTLAFAADLLSFDWGHFPFCYPLGSKLKNILVFSGSRSQIHGDTYVIGWYVFFSEARYILSQQLDEVGELVFSCVYS
jgi:hypothetical protein